MKLYQKQFIEFVLNRNLLKFGKFILKSKRESPYFFNIGMFNTGNDLLMLGRFYATKLVNSGIKFTVLFGPAYKGIPITIATAIALAEYYKLNIPYCFNRKEIKNYGEGGSLIGSPLIKKQVMLVDDVITAGTAIREAMKIIQDNNATLVGILISLDRQERSEANVSIAYEIERDYNCKVISIITLNDLISYLKEKPEMANNLLALQIYKEKFGI